MYFITTLQLGKRSDDPKWNELIREGLKSDILKETYIKESRCVGYFNSYEEAEEIVTGNYGDLYEEGYYQYAVIENIPEGLYQYDFEPVFFKWDNGEFKKCDRPEGLENICGLSIG